MYIVKFIPGPWYWFSETTVTTQVEHAGEFTMEEIGDSLSISNAEGVRFYEIAPVGSNHHKSLLKL